MKRARSIRVLLYKKSIGTEFKAINGKASSVGGGDKQGFGDTTASPQREGCSESGDLLISFRRKIRFRTSI